MKKIIILLLIILPISTISKAQTASEKVDILWGDELKESKKATLSDVIAYDGSGFYTISTRAGGVYGNNETVKISHFNNKVKLVKEAELELYLGKKDMEFEFFVQMNSQIHVFSSYANKKTKTNGLYTQTINKKTLLPNNDRKKIAEIPFTNKFFKGAGAFDYSLSSDSSKIILFYHLPYEKKESEKFGFHVLDQKMNEIWANDITLPYTDELFEIHDHILDNFGNVHVLGKKYKDKPKDRRKGNPNFNYVILSYFKGENKVREYDVKLEEKYLAEMHIVINMDHELICAGFYSNSGTLEADGSFYLKIDSESKEIVVKNFKEFDLNFITQNMSDKEEKKARKKDAKGKDTELWMYDLKEFVIYDDGSIILIGEQYYVETKTKTTTSNGSTKTTTTYYYHYNDIVVVNIDFMGNILWAEKVGKKQRTINDGGFFSSYNLSVVGDKLYFVFNDHPDNEFLGDNEDEYETFRGNKKSMIAIVEMDIDGNQNRSTLVSAKEAGVMTRPKVCEQISNNQMVLFGQRGKKQRFAIVTFK